MRTPTARPPRFFPIPDVADQLEVSPKTVRRWVARGELHVHRLGRQLRVSEDDLLTFIAARRR